MILELFPADMDTDRIQVFRFHDSKSLKTFTLNIRTLYVVLSFGAWFGLIFVFHDVMMFFTGRVKEFTILHPDPDSQGINMNHVLSAGLLLLTVEPEHSPPE